MGVTVEELFIGPYCLIAQGVFFFQMRWESDLRHWRHALARGSELVTDRNVRCPWYLFVVFSLCFLGLLIVVFPAHVAVASAVLIAVWALLRAKPQSIMMLLVWFAALGTILAIGFAVVQGQSSFLLPGLLFALIGVVLYSKRNDPAMDLFAPFVIVCIGFLVLFGWVGLQHLWSGDIPPDLVTSSLWYISIGFVCFVLGYAIPIPKIRVARLWLRGDNWPQGRMTFAVVICSFLGLASFYFVMRSAGYRSLIAIYTDVLLFRFSTYGELSALVFFTQTAFSTGCILLLLKILKKRHVQLIDLGVFAAYFLFVFVVFAAFGTRGPFLTLLVGLLMCFHYLKRRIKPRQLALIAVLAGLFAASYGLYRNVGPSWHSTGQAEDALRQLNVYDAVLSRLDCLSVFTVVLDHPPRYDARSFLTGILLRPLPRQWAPTKPLASSSEITKEYYPGLFRDQIGLEPAIFGELYFYFGVSGIILGMIAFGLCVKLLQKYYEGRTARPDFLLHYALIFTFPISTLLTGYDALGTYVIAALTAWTWVVLSFLNAKGLRGTAVHSTSSEAASTQRALVKGHTPG